MRDQNTAVIIREKRMIQYARAAGD